MAASTAVLASSLTSSEPLMTRETVVRPTPARAATVLIVGRCLLPMEPPSRQVGQTVIRRAGPGRDLPPFACAFCQNAPAADGAGERRADIPRNKVASTS